MARSDVASRVVRWQRRHGRHDLPWQADRDPYKVWLSEVMLQQTQVATVKDYFRRFLDRFPTVTDLAQASLDEVLGLWSGLGYYSRARNLHRCAQAIVAGHGGSFPADEEALAALPGIGRSTAAAIASLCFGRRAAILDGNVRRVVARLCGFEGDLSSATQQRALWAVAESLLPEGGGADTMARYTQGMMDLGAMVCLPRAPLCAQCPVQEACVARRSGQPERLPVRTRRQRRTSQSVWLLWAQDGRGGVWLQQRPAPGVWGGLYCLPWFDSRASLIEALPPGERERVIDGLPQRHVLTHRDLHLHPVRWAVPDGAEGPAGTRHFGRAAWPALGLPAPVRAWLDQDGSQPNEVAG